MIVVTNTNDAGPGSLRQAVIDAVAGEQIVFSFGGTIALTSGVINIAKNLNIVNSPSNSLIVSGNGTFRIFNITVGTVNMSGFTIAGGASAQGAGIHNSGTLTLTDITIGYCNSTDTGGGLYNDSTVFLNNCTITSCTAATDGGGIWNTGTLTANNVVVTLCSSTGDGGGTWNDGTVEHKVGSISSCAANGFVGGGGVYNDGTYTLEDLTVSLCTCPNGNGDAVWNGFGTVYLTRVTITSSTAIAVYNTAGTIACDNSTISDNANTGFWGAGGAMTIYHSTIVGNNFGVVCDTGAFADFYNTILAGNTTNDYDGDSISPTSLGHNIFGNNTNPISPGAGDQIILTYAALVIGPLQDNGGPTFTHALLAGSPAIDLGDNSGAPATDQRGETRIRGGTIDIGAYESNLGPEPPEPPEPPTPPTPPPPPAPGTTPVVPPPPQGHHLAPCPTPLVPCFAPVLGVGETPGIPNLSAEAPDVDISTAVVHPPPWKVPPLEGGGGIIPGIDPPFVNPVIHDSDSNGPQPCTTQQYGLFGYTLGGNLNAACNPNMPGPNSPPDIPNWPNPSQDPGQPPSPRRVFPNTEQTCTAYCADGTVFSYTTPARTFWDPSQRLADVMANTYACKQAALQSICIAGGLASGCRGTSYNQIISVSTQSPRSFTWSILGSLPPGLSYEVLPGGGGIRITGTTTVAGSYAFTVLAVDANGVNVSRGYVVGVLALDTALPDGEVSSNYSEQLVVTGAVAAATFTLQSGALPVGLILSATGGVFGIPLVDGSYHFVVAATTSGVTCTKEYTVTIDPEPACVDWSAPVVNPFTTILGNPAAPYIAFCNRSSSFAANGFTYAVSEASNSTGGFTEAVDSITQSYTGEGCFIRLTVIFNGGFNQIPNSFYAGSNVVNVTVDCGVNLLSVSSGFNPGDMQPGISNVFDIAIPACLVPTDVVVTITATCSPSRGTIQASWQVENL